MQPPGRPHASTFELIEAIALREPQRLALVQDDQGWTYQEVYLDLVRGMRVMRELGVQRGQRVAVGTAGFQTGLLLLIAAESLGAVTTFFLYAQDPDAGALFGCVDWVFSDFPQEAPATARFVAVDEDFVARFRSADTGHREQLDVVALAPHEPQRISRTSGSSGRSKFMALSRKGQEYWIANAAAFMDLRPDSRLLVVGPLVMNGMFSRASACLRIGAAVMDLSRSPVAGHDVTHIASMPVHLEMLLAALPTGYAPSHPVDVLAVGGFLTPSLRAKLAHRFGGRVSSRYGTNETGVICDDIDAAGVGIVSPGVDIQVVDEEGRELPQGGLGIVAVRTPSMAGGYINEDAASHAAFRDGWFHSGDWGTLIAPRVLRLAGRHDDLVNVGGLKVSAYVVEEQVRQGAQLVDCAVLATNLDDGNTNLGIAVVVAPGASRDDVRNRVAGIQFGATLATRVLFLESIPRLASGKVDRLALHRLFQASVKEAS